jgi:hypothetical protein
VPHLDLERLNLILYADHGMVFSDQTIDIEGALGQIVGEQLLYYAFPNVYLREPVLRTVIARRLALETDIDFVFYRAGADRVEGYFHREFVVFEAFEGGLRYLAEADPLAYGALGYSGAALSDQAWLELTATSYYPAVPPNVFHYLRQRDVGDLVVGLNRPKIPLTVRANRGNHVSLTRVDMVVPVLFRGPELEPYYTLETLWLHTLYQLGPAPDFGFVPDREAHRLDVWIDLSGEPPRPAAQLLISPAYRLRFGVQARFDGLDLWGEYDVYSSYLTRWWLGAGATYRGQLLSPLVVAQVELDVAEFGLSLRGSGSRTGWGVGLSLSFLVGNGARVTWHAPYGVGASVAW